MKIQNKIFYISCLFLLFGIFIVVIFCGSVYNEPTQEPNYQTISGVPVSVATFHERCWSCITIVLEDNIICVASESSIDGQFVGRLYRGSC